MLKAVVASNINPRQATDQMLREVSFLRRKNNGNNRMGRNMPADAVLATVSAKTTVT
jgi:hypothetical protein